MHFKNSFLQTWIPHKPRYLAFMLGLIILLLAHALFDSAARGARLLDITFLIVFVTTLFAAWRQVWFIVAVVVLGVPMFGLQMLSNFFHAGLLEIISHVFGALFFSFLFVSILIDILKTSKVTMNTIYGAVSVYLLIGIAWTFLFGLVEHIHPGSISMPQTLEPFLVSKQQHFNVLMYFSFTSLTTLGFGDINPVVPIARTLSYLEAVIGQLYLTILVARLVGLHIATTQNH